MDETIGLGEVTSSAISKEKFIPRGNVHSIAREEARKQHNRDFVRMKNYLAKKLKQFNLNPNKKGNNQSKKNNHKKAKTSHPNNSSNKNDKGKNSNNKKKQSDAQIEDSDHDSTSEVFVANRTDDNASEVTCETTTSPPPSLESGEESNSTDSSN